jgi:hypothetical protein
METEKINKMKRLIKDKIFLITVSAILIFLILTVTVSCSDSSTHKQTKHKETSNAVVTIDGDYLVDQFRGRIYLNTDDKNRFQNLLNKRSKEGWEFFKLQNRHAQSATNDYIMIYKKKK